jgi:hypothetical protein
MKTVKTRLLVFTVLLLFTAAVFQLAAQQNEAQRERLAEIRASAEQSQAQDFIVTAKDTPDGLVVLVHERDSGKQVLSKITNGLALNGNLDAGRKAALTVTSQNSGPNLPVASGAFIVKSDKLIGGVYEATVHRMRPDEIRVPTSDEAKQWASAESAREHASDFVKDATLPRDTVRLAPAVQIKPGRFFDTQPTLVHGGLLAGTSLVKVLRNDGTPAGWACMFTAQVEDLHDEANAIQRQSGLAIEDRPEIRRLPAIYGSCF